VLIELTNKRRADVWAKALDDREPDQYPKSAERLGRALKPAEALL
jgi:hypothetical protein